MMRRRKETYWNTDSINRVTDLELEDKFDSIDLNSKNEIELISSLSKSEVEIHKLIVEGFIDTEIGKELRISFYIVDTHIKNIINKLKVKNTASLALKAGEIGILS